MAQVGPQAPFSGPEEIDKNVSGWRKRYAGVGDSKKISAKQHRNDMRFLDKLTKQYKTIMESDDPEDIFEINDMMKQGKFKTRKELADKFFERNQKSEGYYPQKYDNFTKRSFDQNQHLLRGIPLVGGVMDTYQAARDATVEGVQNIHKGITGQGIGVNPANYSETYDLRRKIGETTHPKKAMAAEVTGGLASSGPLGLWKAGQKAMGGFLPGVAKPIIQGAGAGTLVGAGNYMAREFGDADDPDDPYNVGRRVEAMVENKEALFKNALVGGLFGGGVPAGFSTLGHIQKKIARGRSGRLENIAGSMLDEVTDGVKITGKGKPDEMPMLELKDPLEVGALFHSIAGQGGKQVPLLGKIKEARAYTKAKYETAKNALWDDFRAKSSRTHFFPNSKVEKFFSQRGRTIEEALPHMRDDEHRDVIEAALKAYRGGKGVKIPAPAMEELRGAINSLGAGNPEAAALSRISKEIIGIAPNGNKFQDRYRAIVAEHKKAAEDYETTVHKFEAAEDGLTFGHGEKTKTRAEKAGGTAKVIPNYVYARKYWDRELARAMYANTAPKVRIDKDVADQLGELFTTTPAERLAKASPTTQNPNVNPVTKGLATPSAPGVPMGTKGRVNRVVHGSKLDRLLFPKGDAYSRRLQQKAQARKAGKSAAGHAAAFSGTQPTSEAIPSVVEPANKYVVEPAGKLIDMIKGLFPDDESP